MTKNKELYSFRISKETIEEFEELCKRLGVRPKSYLRIIVKREIARLKENLSKLKEN